MLFSESDVQVGNFPADPATIAPHSSSSSVEMIAISRESSLPVSSSQCSPSSSSIDSAIATVLSSLATPSEQVVVSSSDGRPFDQMMNVVSALPALETVSAALPDNSANIVSASHVVLPQNSMLNENQSSSTSSTSSTSAISGALSNSSVFPGFGCFAKFNPGSLWNALVCRLCGFPKSSVEELEAHIAWDHWNWVPFQCCYCAQVFRPTQYTLRLHLQEVHPDQPHKIVCSIDDKKALDLRVEVQSAIQTLLNQQNQAFQLQNSSEKLTQAVEQQQEHTSSSSSAHKSSSEKTLGFAGLQGIQPSDGLVFTRILQQQLQHLKKPESAAEWSVERECSKVASKKPSTVVAQRDSLRNHTSISSANNDSRCNPENQSVTGTSSPMVHSRSISGNHLISAAAADQSKGNSTKIRPSGTYKPPSQLRNFPSTATASQAQQNDSQMPAEKNAEVEPIKGKSPIALKDLPDEIECKICGAYIKLKSWPEGLLSSKVSQVKASILGHVYEHAFESGCGYRYQCGSCGFGAVRKFEFYDHHRINHSNDRMQLVDRTHMMHPVVIKLQKQCFPNVDPAVWSQTHIRCKLCHCEVTKKQKLAHLYRVHLKVNMMKCEYCNFTQPYGSGKMNLHTATEHPRLPVSTQSLVPYYRKEIAELREQCFGEMVDKSANRDTMSDTAQGSSSSSSPDFNQAQMELEWRYPKEEDNMASDDDCVVIHS